MELKLDDTLVKLLGFSLLGLSFLFVVLGFFLLQKEQARQEPRTSIIKTLWIYLGTCFFLCIIVGIFTLFNKNIETCNAQILQKQRQIAFINITDSLVSQIDNLLLNDSGKINTNEIENLESQILGHVDAAKEVSDDSNTGNKNTNPTINIAAKKAAIKKEFFIVKDSNNNKDSIKLALTRIRIQTQGINKLPVNANSKF